MLSWGFPPLLIIPFVITIYLAYFHRCLNFQKAVQARVFRLSKSLALDPIIEPSIWSWSHGLWDFHTLRVEAGLAVDGHILSFGCADNKAKICCGVSGPGELRLGPRHWRLKEGDVVRTYWSTYGKVLPSSFPLKSNCLTQPVSQYCCMAASHG